MKDGWLIFGLSDDGLVSLSGYRGKGDIQNGGEAKRHWKTVRERVLLGEVQEGAIPDSTPGAESHRYSPSFWNFVVCVLQQNKRF